MSIKITGITKIGDYDLEFDPFSDDYTPDESALEPFPGPPPIENPVSYLDGLFYDEPQLPDEENIIDNSENKGSRDGYLANLFTKASFKIMVPGPKHGIKGGIPWRRYEIPKTDDQFRKLLDKELGCKEIIDKHLFIKAVINKYESIIEEIDNQLTPQEKIDYFEARQPFVAFINWLKKDNVKKPEIENISKKNKTSMPARSKSLRDILLVPETSKDACLLECIGLLSEEWIDAFNSDGQYNPEKPKNRIAYWIKALTGFQLFEKQDNRKVTALILSNYFQGQGLEIKHTTLEKPANFDGRTTDKIEKKIKEIVKKYKIDKNTN